MYIHTTRKYVATSVLEIAALLIDMFDQQPNRHPRSWCVASQARCVASREVRQLNWFTIHACSIIMMIAAEAIISLPQRADTKQILRRAFEPPSCRSPWSCLVWLKRAGARHMTCDVIPQVHLLLLGPGSSTNLRFFLGFMPGSQHADIQSTKYTYNHF